MADVSMSPGAELELRTRIYQEGQRAYRAGTPCPYVDWRAKTWAKCRAAGEAYANATTVPVVTPAGICEMTQVQLDVYEWAKLSPNERIARLLARIEVLEDQVAHLREVTP